jgi:hypothetical protein
MPPRSRPKGKNIPTAAARPGRGMVLPGGGAGRIATAIQAVARLARMAAPIVKSTSPVDRFIDAA